MNIIDTHVHLWDPAHFRMAWLDDAPAINQAFLPADLTKHAAPHIVDGYVYVEVNVAQEYALEEARWVERLAQTDPRIKGIVAHAPIEYGRQCAAYLDLLAQTSPRIKGVRRLIQSMPDASPIASQRFIDGLKLLPAYGWSFDICVKHPQMDHTLNMVRACPEVQFVLDHIGKPDIASRQLDPWRGYVSALAALPNVSCKLSGAVTEADRATWSADDLRPYIHHVLSAFGEDRVMFGGDWPVVLLASPYVRWADTLAILTQHLSPTAQAKLWRENAKRIYRIQ